MIGVKNVEDISSRKLTSSGKDFGSDMPTTTAKRNKRLPEKKKSGLTVARVFSKAGINPFDELE